MKTWEEIKEEWDKEDQKKNLRNWVNNKFPNSIAGYNAFHSLTHPWIILLEWKRQIKWAYQRVFNGFDERISWSIDWYLSENIPLWIEQLKKNKHGYPQEMLDGMKHNGNWEYSPEDEKLAEEKWDSILDDIRDGFLAYGKIDDYWSDKPKQQEMIDKFNHGFDLFRKYYSGLWD